ncbi:MAG: AMP-binding protein, partial [Pseudomonadota bacterium]
MHPSIHAANKPEHPAIIMSGSGQRMSYAELESRSNQIAHAFRGIGLRAGDHIAFQLENCIEFMTIVIAAQRAGLVYTAISTHLLQEEVAYIVANSQAKLLITSPAFVDVAKATSGADGELHRWLLRGEADEFESFEAIVDAQTTTPIDDEEMGAQMLYSSGTTGYPKGVLSTRKVGTPIDQPHPMALMLVSAFGIGPEACYLSPAPLYHAAPLTFTTLVLTLGGTAVIMEKFDAQQALAAIDQYQVTHSQWVPIMFVRMLKLPKQTREQFDLSSHQVAIHGAAPCPVDIKRQMIDWWGPRIAEYYASTEGAG